MMKLHLFVSHTYKCIWSSSKQQEWVKLVIQKNILVNTPSWIFFNRYFTFEIFASLWDQIILMLCFPNYFNIKSISIQYSLFTQIAKFVPKKMVSILVVMFDKVFFRVLISSGSTIQDRTDTVNMLRSI